LNGPELTVSIISYNTRSLLRACLSSVYEKAKGVGFEVIVVDNNSTDDTPEMLRRDFPQVQLIENRENLGFAGANNQAIRKGKGKYVLFLNPDSIFSSGSLSQMIRFMDGHPEVGALGCKILNADRTIQTSNAHFPNLFTEFLRAFQLKKILPSARIRSKIGERYSHLLGSTLGEYLRVYWDSGRVRPVSWATGACLLVKRKAVEEIGLMDEGFFMYYEDTDLCYRMHQKGWKVCYFPFFEVIHYVGESNGKFNPEVFVQRQKSMYHYFRKHQSEVAVLLLNLIVRSALALRLMGLLVLCPFIKIIQGNQEELRKKYRAYFRSIALRPF